MVIEKCIIVLKPGNCQTSRSHSTQQGRGGEEESGITTVNEETM